MNHKKLLLQSVIVLLLLSSCSDEKPTQPTDTHYGYIYIATQPDNAEIFINNVSISQFSPAAVKVTAGTQIVTVKKSGYLDTAVTIDIISGETIVRSVDLLKTAQGAISLHSFPQGAMIYMNDSSIGKATPATIENLTAGLENVSLKLAGYRDTTFTVTVTAGQTTSKTVVMSALPLMIITYNDIKIYELASSNLSALKLATGTNVSSSSGDADLFYALTEIKSQHLRTPAPATLNYTSFYNRVSFTSLDDGVDAPENSSTGRIWTYTKAITATSYSFLYTNDHHFVKLKITETGGGTGPPDPDKWVKVSYKYNQIARDRRF